MGQGVGDCVLQANGACSSKLPRLRAPGGFVGLNRGGCRLLSKTRQRECDADETAARPEKVPRAGWPDCSLRTHSSLLSTRRTNQRRWNCVKFGGWDARGPGGIPTASGIIPDLGWCENASSFRLPPVTSARVLLAPKSGSCLLRRNNCCFQSPCLGSRSERVRRRGRPSAHLVIDE